METGIPMRKLLQLIQIRENGGLVQDGSCERTEK